MKYVGISMILILAGLISVYGDIHGKPVEYANGDTVLKGYLYTLKEVEHLTRLSRSTLYRRLRIGSLQGYQLDNGMWRVSWEEVQRVLGRLQARAEAE